jgi:hypothetical protein
MKLLKYGTIPLCYGLLDSKCCDPNLASWLTLGNKKNMCLGQNQATGVTRNLVKCKFETKHMPRKMKHSSKQSENIW